MFMHFHSFTVRSLVTTITLLTALLHPGLASADWTQARCDIYPRGSDRASVTLPCVFSQTQGHVVITRSDGVTYDLIPVEDTPDHYRDAKGNDGYVEYGLGKQGLIFRLNSESVYVYWDASGLGEENPTGDYTAPYSTPEYDATARLPCSLQGSVTRDGADCPAGVKRDAKAGQARVHLLRPDGVERILEFHTDRVTTPGNGRIQAVRQANDDWRITIEDHESYLVPDAFIEGD